MFASAEETTLWVTVASALVALLGAFVAARSASAARRQTQISESALRETRAQTVLAQGALGATRQQNEIAIHDRRLEIYECFLHFKYEVSAKGWNFNEHEAFVFWRKAKIAEFYFPSEVHLAMEAVVDQALSLKRVVATLEDNDSLSIEEVTKLRDERSQKNLLLNDTLDRLNVETRTQLKVAAAY